MNKQIISGLNDVYYYEILDNGLEIYLFPDSRTKRFNVDITIPYGGMTTEFIDAKTKKQYNFPKGVAHFLEHQTFQKENDSLLNVFEQIGINAGAFTNLQKTCYHFYGTSNLKKGLNLFLDAILEPNFTDKGTNKEKGIIIEEMRIRRNNPVYLEYYEILDSLIVKHPAKNSVIGSEEDILSITTKDLKNYHKYLYQPSNIIIGVSGNINVLKTIEIIKANLNNKPHLQKFDLEFNPIIEPNEVNDQYREIELDVSSSRCNLAYKFNYEVFKNFDISLQEILAYIDITLDINFGKESIFNQDLIDKQIISKPLYYSLDSNLDFFYIRFHFISNNIPEATQLIKDKLKNIIITQDKLDLISKRAKSYAILRSENKDYYLEKLAYYIDERLPFDKDFFNKYNYIPLDVVNNVFSKLDFSAESILVVNPKK